MKTEEQIKEQIKIYENLADNSEKMRDKGGIDMAVYYLDALRWVLEVKK